MTVTTVPFGDPKAAKKWATNTWVDIKKKSYFEGRFIGQDDNSIIQRKTELENDAGDTISFDLCVQLRNSPTFGDTRLEGKEESLKFYTDTVSIDQIRHGVSCGGKMSRKRTAIDMRSTGKARLSDYFSRLNDELLFMYLSGARGVNEDFILPTDFAGYANNAFAAPDVDHVMYGGSATSKATLAASDKMTKAVIERAAVKANMMQALNPDSANMVPASTDNGENYVMLMNPFQEYDLRQNDTSGWLDIQKALTTAVGKENPIFKGGLGMVNNVVLHSHRNVVRFTDYGAGGNVQAARALFMGRQAAVIGYGSTGGMRMDWSEETNDHGNEPVIAAGFIAGMKKTRFNGKDFGVMSIDTAAVNPN